MGSNYPKFIKYFKIPHLDEIPNILDKPVIVSEKIDGGNCQVRKYKGRILAGNRSRFLTDKDIQFDWFQDFLKWAKGNYDFYNLPENLIVFGEWLSPHTLEYPKENQNKFYVIDIFDINQNKFLFYDKAKDFLKQKGIKNLNFLRLLHSGKINRQELEKLVEHSDYRKDKSEGIVVKDYANQLFAKLWTSSIKRDSQLTYSDLQRVYLSLNESEKNVSKEKVYFELHKDLINSGLKISIDDVKKFVNANYFYLNPNLSVIHSLSRHL